MCSNRACGLVLYLATTAFVLPAQTLTPLAAFKGANGISPHGSLVQGMDGSLYGTAEYGGSGAGGVIFNLAKGAGLTDFHSFILNSGDSSGQNPMGGLLLAADGNFYGTTELSSPGFGTIFKITPDGALTTIHTFAGTDGSWSQAGLVKAENGDLYGTTTFSFVFPNFGYGTIFKITTAGVLTTLHSFNLTDGADPLAGLVQATNGNLYGTASEGGNTTCYAPKGCGTVFKITPDGVFTTLHIFDQNDGANPLAALVQASDGNLYGTTNSGGLAACNPPYGCGTIFRITSDGVLATIHNFDGADGVGPSGLVQATDGNLYGTTQYGGNTTCTNGCGTIFKIGLDGTFTSLYSDFGSGVGFRPQPHAALLQATDGDFYGTTALGPAPSSSGDGSIFKFSVGLGPFVKTLPGLGAVGSHVRILGDDLTGATSVTFNGVAAAFSVVSPAQIVATVPAGATTGKVQVIAPGGTLLSTVGFVVP